MKKTMLYVSPFWPCRSGISQYSEELVDGLNKYYDITLLTDNYLPESQELVHKYKIITNYKEHDLSKFDFILYNFGNNPEFHCYMYEMMETYSGYVILHDVILYYLTVGYYESKNRLFQKIYELQGPEGITVIKKSLREIESRELLEHKSISFSLPLNQEILKRAKGVFVHSNYSREIIKKISPETKVEVIPLVNTYGTGQNEKKCVDFLRKRYKLSKGQYIIGSIGLIGPSKQNEIVCRAVQSYNETHENKIVYVMCGDGNYVDDYVDNKYIFKTGFLKNSEFFAAISSCNSIANLRYPYNGEASATLIQCMYLGKTCLVTDIGWFNELPDDTVIKLSRETSIDELAAVLDRLINDNSNKTAQNAQKFVENQCNKYSIGKQICEVLSKG